MDSQKTIDLIVEQGLNTFLDYASIGIILVDSKMQIMLVNKFAENLFGFQQNEIFGKKIEILIPMRYHDAHKHHHSDYFKNPQNRPMGLGMDLFGVKKSGAEFPVEVSLGTYKIKEEVYIISFINDITKRKSIEADIKRLNAELEKKVLERTEALADAIIKLQKQIKETEEAEAELAVSLAKEKELGELKSRFVSMASHEFRTPLSTITSSAYLLQQYVTTEDQPKREKHLERILASVNTLTDILEDFLSLGKMDEGKIEAKISKADIEEHIKLAINQVKPILKAGQQIFYAHKGASMVNFDPSLLRHIVLNLISNSIKFSEKNQPIHVNTNTLENPWLLTIRDEGIGISEADQQNLFERFFRGANALTIQGTGLGLHIVSKYVQMMGGSMTCESALSKGTRMTIKFPDN
ncbi:MAG: PAS domain-containing sensor histidine kinase [Saprospiraceae bacterium]|nr:PAS domain-containing sensor histidine kinase [Saprospiraceae bacterium]